MIEVRTQAELDKAMERPEVRDGEELIVILGDGRFVVVEGTPWLETSAGPTVVTRETSNATVETWETSNVTGKIGKWSQPCFWRHDDSTINIPGAVILVPPEVNTAEEWLDYYGVETKDGVATLYKAVGGDFVSSRGFAYEPGSAPACEDWDPNRYINCGQGLHFCPAPSVAFTYRRNAEKFVACPVAVSEIIVHQGAGIPDKVRAPRVAAPVWECDIDGEPVENDHG